MTDIKNELDILDKMIDHVQRKIRSNDNMMGMVNSTYEYETFFGIKADEKALNEGRANSEALSRMLNYRSYLMNNAVGINVETVTLDLTNITFGTGETAYTFKF